MSKYKSELTRRYLLNSHSREVMDEVVQDGEDVEFGADTDPEAVSDIRAVRGTGTDRNLEIGADVEFGADSDPDAVSDVRAVRGTGTDRNLEIGANVEFGADTDPEAVSDIRAVRGTGTDRNLEISANVEFASDLEAYGESEDEEGHVLGNKSFLGKWEGKERTHDYYRRSYE